jgi:hypothetical protein
MHTRTHIRTVRFDFPFYLPSIDELQAPGDYQIETDEEQIDSMTSIAYRRTATFIHLHPQPSQPGINQMVLIEPDELERALKDDGDRCSRSQTSGERQ